ncbi:hypothetical protein HK414_03750 [Ramlibacter terrae]|uniref:Lipoprotein n=1 Tax=Ramlibacter terrae TaxID=2732511 RepID=A0ABX6P0J2_9BURK|nr:hypothetical protein HK414_03750 [Ramlibacter terrae]
MLSSATTSRPLRRFFTAALLAGAALLTGCATHYVDGAHKNAVGVVKPAQPAPVQLVFEFQTKGVANARASQLVKPMVAEDVRASGLFAEVTDGPAPRGGMLSVSLNNVALTDDAAAKGFMAGLTFGMAGQQVTDGYICTVSYLAPGQSQPVVATSRHAIHTTVGNHGGPANAYKASSMEDALRVMVREAVGSALATLSRESGFR